MSRMEEEKFFTGYCRVLDSGRTVACLYEAGQLTEADCRYGSCLYQNTCPIGKAIADAGQQKGSSFASFRRNRPE